MPTIERSALVPHSAEQMFEIVRDVESYPAFLPWCSGARVISESGDEQLAELELSRGGMRQKFSTRNHLTRPTSLHIELEKGPFKRLRGEWRFTPLGDAGCKVALHLAFEPDSRLMNVALGQVWRMATDRMVDAFCARAEALHG